MHLRFTENELLTLVEMLGLAASVASWNHKPGSDDGVAAWEALEARILEKAKLSGYGDIIEYDAEKQRHQLSEDYLAESFYQECYDEFRNENFWEELVIRLADRDLAREIGTEAWEAMPEEDRRTRTAGIEKRYWDELSRHGVERLAIIFPPGEG